MMDSNAWRSCCYLHAAHQFRAARWMAHAAGPGCGNWVGHVISAESSVQNQYPFDQMRQ